MGGLGLRSVSRRWGRTWIRNSGAAADDAARFWDGSTVARLYQMLGETTACAV